MTQRSPGRRALLAGACVIIGSAAAVQSHLAATLTTSLGGTLSAAVFTAGFLCVVGLFALLMVAIAVPSYRRTIPSLWHLPRRSVPLWVWPGAAAGIVVAVIQAATVPVIGVALFAIGFVAGQTLAGLLADRMGMVSGERVPVTAVRVAAVVLALAGAAISVTGRVQANPVELLTVVVAMIPGAATTIQSAANGRLTIATRAPIAVALLNFVLGAAVSVVLLGALLWLNGTDLALPGDLSTWWGGLVGVLLVLSSAIAVPLVGALVYALCLVAGQLAGSLVVEFFINPGSRENLIPVAVGAAVVCLAVALGTLWVPRRYRRTRTLAKENRDDRATT